MKIDNPPIQCDVFVYGSTPGGIAAALEAARGGLKVILACPKMHLGGMAASGLCTTDAVRRHLFGALVGEFVERVRNYYLKILGENSPEYKLCHDGWYYEPSVAEICFNEMLEYESTNLSCLKGQFLQSVKTEQGAIKTVSLANKKNEITCIAARVYIDGTYEGDLAASAGVPYRVGRESREEFGESLAGIHYMNWRTGREIITELSGDASPAIQSFCARSIITDDPAHLVKIEKPASYDLHLQDYIPILGDFKSARVKSVDDIVMGALLPGRKQEINGHIEALTSLNCPGVSWEYPEAGYKLREELDKFHVEHAAGLLYFLQNDPHVPSEIASHLRKFGLHDEEFKDNNNWPWQIYVRQGRRIKGRAVITQHNFIVNPETGRTPEVEGAVALGEHSFDIHPCHDRRYSRDSFAEGVLWYPAKDKGPAQPGQIPYGALLPVNFDNLIVPVAMSCTHIAMSVLRMEPVWMTTGQIAGAAAVFAVEKNCSPAGLDPHIITRKLNIRNTP